MYVEIVLVIVIFIVLFLCLKKNKEKFNALNGSNTKWFDTLIYDSEKHNTYSSLDDYETKNRNIKNQRDNYFKPNINPSLETENQKSDRPMFYEETNKQDTRFNDENGKDREFLYKRFDEKEIDSAMKESREGPKISKLFEGSLYFDKINKKKSEPDTYKNNNYDYINNMNIEDYTLYQLKKKQDIPYVYKPSFNDQNDLYNKFDDHKNINDSDIPISRNYYTSVDENLYEINKIIIDGNVGSINKLILISSVNNKEIEVTTSTSEKSYNLRYFKNSRVLTLNFMYANNNEAFKIHKFNIKKIKIKNDDNDNIFDSTMKIHFNNIDNGKEKIHEIKLDDYKPKIKNRNDRRFQNTILITLPPYNNMRIRKQKYNDLFGKLHDIQSPTKTFVVSRGYPQEKGVEVGFETKNFTSPLTNKIVKSCPIPAVQTYEFDPSSKGLNLGLVSKEEEERRTAKYFTEKGGTYFDTNGNECRLCDFPDGCFSPWAAKEGGDEKRVKQYEIQSCRKGQNRECMRCSECATGEEKIVTFCGEGGGKADTKCEPCTPCPEGTYKAYGCDKADTTIDNYCVPMTQCKGKPTSQSGYDDPGEGNYYYMKKDGSRGSNSYIAPPNNNSHAISPADSPAPSIDENKFYDKHGYYEKHYFKKKGGIAVTNDVKTQIRYIKLKSEKDNLEINSLKIVLQKENEKSEKEVTIYENNTEKKNVKVITGDPKEITLDLANFEDQDYDLSHIKKIIINYNTSEASDILKSQLELVTNYGEIHRLIPLSIYEGMTNSNIKIEAEIPALKQKKNKYFNHLPNDVNIIREAVFSVLSAEEKKKN